MMQDGKRWRCLTARPRKQKKKKSYIHFLFFLPAKQLESAEKWKNVQSSLADNKEEGTAISHGFYLHLWYCIMHCVGSSLYAHTLSILEYNSLTRCEHIWGKNTKITTFSFFYSRFCGTWRKEQCNKIQYNVLQIWNYLWFCSRSTHCFISELELSTAQDIKWNNTPHVQR